VSSGESLVFGEDEVGDGLLDEGGEFVGDPETTKWPPVLTAAAGSTDGSCDNTGLV
jgi:hypothetical protein